MATMTIWWTQQMIFLDYDKKTIALFGHHHFLNRSGSCMNGSELTVLICNLCKNNNNSIYYCVHSCACLGSAQSLSRLCRSQKGQASAAFPSLSCFSISSVASSFSFCRFLIFLFQSVFLFSFPYILSLSLSLHFFSLVLCLSFSLLDKHTSHSFQIWNHAHVRHHILCTLA